MSHPAWYNEWKTGQKAPLPAPVPKTRPGMVRINILTMKTGEFADTKEWSLSQVSNVYIKVIEPIAEAGFYVELLQDNKLWGRSRIDAQTFIMLKSKGVKEDDPTLGHGYGKKMDDLIYFNALKLMKEGQSEFLKYYMEETGTAGTTGTAPVKKELDTISRTPIDPSVEPYFKWMGSKRKLVYEYDRDGLIPKEVKGLYVEPLAGSVAVYLYMRSKGSIGRAVIGDENPYLIATLQAIRDRPDVVARYLQEFEDAYNEVDFTTGTTEDKAPDYAWDTLDLKYFKSRYAMFHWFRRSLTEDYKKASKEFTAATFLFIIATCFNALIRFNSQLKCNSPFGQRTHVKFFEKKPSFKDSQIDLMAMSRALKGVDIYEQDYRETMKMAQAGDFVFLDPPYWPSSETASFKQYYRTRWDPRDFIDLSEEVKGLCKRGALVLFANADLPEIHKLFGFLPTVKRYDVKRMGSSQGETRGRPVSELAMANYEPFTFKVIPIESDLRIILNRQERSELSAMGLPRKDIHHIVSGVEKDTWGYIKELGADIIEANSDQRGMILMREVATVHRGELGQQLQEGDIILTRVSGTPRLVGTPKLIRANETWPSRADNFIHLRLTPKGRQVFVPDFLYYYIQLQHQRGYFERRATGSVQKFITIDDVKNLEYSSPGMPLPDARSDDMDKVAEGIWRSGMYGLGQDYDAFTKDPNRHTYKAVIERLRWVIHLWYEISKEHQQEISDHGDPAYNRMKEISARLEEYYAEKEKVEAVKWGETAESQWRKEMDRAIQFYEVGNFIGAYEYVMAAKRYWDHIPIEAKRKLEARGLMDKEFIAYFEILNEIKIRQEEEGEETAPTIITVPKEVAEVVDHFYPEEEVGKCIVIKKGRACDNPPSGHPHKSATYTIRIIRDDYPQVYCEKGHLQHTWEDFQDEIDHCGEAFEKKKKDGREETDEEQWRRAVRKLIPSYKQYDYAHPSPLIYMALFKQYTIAQTLFLKLPKSRQEEIGKNTLLDEEMRWYGEVWETLATDKSMMIQLCEEEEGPKPSLEEEMGKCIVVNKKNRNCDVTGHKVGTYTIRITRGHEELICDQGHIQWSNKDYQLETSNCIGELVKKIGGWEVWEKGHERPERKEIKKEERKWGPELGDYVTVTRADTVNRPQSGDLVMTARGDKFSVGRVEVYHKAMKLDPITDYIIIHPNRPGELDLYKLVRELNRLADIDHYKYAVRGTYPGPYTLEPQSVKAIPMGKRG